MPRPGIGVLRWTGGGARSRTDSATDAPGRSIDVTAPAAWATADWEARVGASNTNYSPTRGHVCLDDPDPLYPRRRFTADVPGSSLARRAHATQPMEQLRHLVHDAANNVVAEERHAHDQPNTNLRPDTLGRGDSMERPDE